MENGISGQTWPRFLPVGDTGLSVEFGAGIDPSANAAVASLDRALATAAVPGVIEAVPSFRSLLIHYEPVLVSWGVLCAEVGKLLGTAAQADAPSATRWTIPVAYDAPFGEDLDEAAALLGLSPAELVSLHTGTEFRVYMIGFQPGLPNLGGLPPRLQLSRRSVPRAPVPAGSVTIGGTQAAIMPMASPIGFYLLGRTPVRPFDRRRAEPALFRTGDAIRFRAIDRDEYARLDAAAAAGDLLAGASPAPVLGG